MVFFSFFFLYHSFWKASKQTKPSRVCVCVCAGVCVCACVLFGYGGEVGLIYKQ